MMRTISRFLLPSLLLPFFAACSTVREPALPEVAPAPAAEVKTRVLSEPVFVQSDWLVERPGEGLGGNSTLRVGLVYSTRVDWSGYANEWLQYRWQEARQIAESTMAKTDFRSARFLSEAGRREWEEGMCRELTAAVFPVVGGQPLATVTAIVWNVSAND